MPVVESAGRLLRDARRRAGLSQVELGRRAGVTQSVISAYESGRREPSMPVLLRLIGATGHVLEATLVPAAAPHSVPLSGVLGRRVHRLRHDIQRIASAHGAGNVRVFGSVARGAERADSDIDLLVDLPRGAGLFALGRLRSELEELLGASVDVIPSDEVKDDVRARIDADVVSLWPDREPDLPWAEIARMRDHLAHRYFDTTHAIVASTVTGDLPLLRQAIDRLLAVVDA